MKNIYILSLIVIFELAVRLEILGADVLPQDCVQEQILNICTRWRNNGSLEVIKIQSVEGEYEGFGIKVSYVSGDMQLTGVNNFTVEQLFVSTNDLEVSATIHFPLLKLTADHYKLTGRAYYMYSLKGAGFMNVTFQNVEVTLGLIVTKGFSVSEVDDVNLNFSVGNIQVSFADSSWPINKVLNSNAMNIVEKYRSTLVATAKGILKNFICEYSSASTPAQILELVDTDCHSLSLNYLLIKK